MFAAIDRIRIFINNFQLTQDIGYTGAASFS